MKDTTGPFLIPPFAIDRVIAVALEEDLASGDLTTEACIDPDARAVARAVARQPMVACGGPVFARVFARVDESLVLEAQVVEGAWVKAGSELWRVSGRARPILMAERVALHLVQRLCGV